MPLWTPADLSVAPAIWFSAQRSTVTQTSGSISAVQNLGSQGNLVQDNSARRPTFSATGWDGSRPSINFDQSALYLDTWSFTGNRLGLFAVTEISGGDGDNHRVINCRDEGNYGWSGVPYTQISHVSAAVGFVSTRNLIDTNIGGGAAKQLINVNHGASGATARINASVTATTSLTGNFGITLVVIGAEFRASDNMIRGKIPEGLVLGYDPTTDERERVEGYLAWEWGIQALLPSGHPYRNAAPQTGSTDITGVMAASESGSDVLSASGAVSISGSMSASEAGSDILSASGTVSVRGSLSSTETGSDVFASGGSVAVSGAMLATEAGQDSFAANGTVTAAGPTGAMNAVETGADAFSAVGTVSGNVTPTPSYQAYYGGNGFSPKPKKGEIEKLERLLFPKKRKPKPVIVKAVVKALKESAPDVSPSILMGIVSNVVEVAPLNEIKVESRIATETMVLRVLELQEEEDIEALLLMS